MTDVFRKHYAYVRIYVRDIFFIYPSSVIYHFFMNGCENFMNGRENFMNGRDVLG